MSAIMELSVEPAKDPNYPANLVPAQYHDLLLLFTQKGANKLPLHRYVDHEIPIGDNKPPMGRMYSMSASKLQEIRACIEDNLSKGSSEPLPVPVPSRSYLLRKRVVPSVFALTTEP